MSQIFTKTLTIQVWRPEFERPGRHFVYTTRYVYFFVGLLDQLDDRTSLDQLLRRVRKKQGDFVDHTKLWEDICLTYAKMIRRAAKINEGHEEGIFRPIGWEEFSTKTARLESLTTFAPESQPLFELIRDALELKKLNNNLMKVTMFEDLIADLYARVYEINMPQLIEQANEENKEKMKVDHLLMAGDGKTEVLTPVGPIQVSDTPSAPRGRTKGIARRDIQKRADTIVNLKLGPRAAAKFTAAADTEQSSSTPRGFNAAATSESAPAPQESDKQESTAEDSTGVRTSEHNGPQDAGNESELSEADDTKPVKDSTDQTKKEPGDGETEDDDGGSGNEGAEEGEGEDDDEGGNEHDGEEDPGATEVETGAEDAPEGDDAEDEVQDGDGNGDGEDAPAGENKAEGESNEDKMVVDGESTPATKDQPEGKAPGDVGQDEDGGNTDSMDTTPA